LSGVLLPLHKGFIFGGQDKNVFANRVAEIEQIPRIVLRNLLFRRMGGDVSLRPKCLAPFVEASVNDFLGLQQNLWVASGSGS
jgi:hypothetical protein